MGILKAIRPTVRWLGARLSKLHCPAAAMAATPANQRPLASHVSLAAGLLRDIYRRLSALTLGRYG